MSESITGLGTETDQTGAGIPALPNNADNAHFCSSDCGDQGTSEIAETINEMDMCVVCMG